jgi:erythromycin 3''-O-methyltransferase
VDPALLNPTTATRWTNLGWWDAATTATASHAIPYPDAARALAQRVGEAARLRPGDVVVDMACGYGDSLALWVSAFGAARVVGVEPNPVVAAAVRARIAAWGLADRIRVVPATAETFDLAAHAADATAVVCVDAAYHFRTRAAWLRAVARAAAPGTRLGFSDLAVTGEAMRTLTGAEGVTPRGLRWGAARADIPTENLWGHDAIADAMAEAGYAAITMTEAGGPILDGFQAFARRSRSAWLRRPQAGGWQALATAWLLGRVRPGLTMVCIGARVR